MSPNPDYSTQPCRATLISFHFTPCAPGYCTTYPHSERPCALSSHSTISWGRSLWCRTVNHPVPRTKKGKTKIMSPLTSEVTVHTTNPNHPGVGFSRGLNQPRGLSSIPRLPLISSVANSAFHLGRDPCGTITHPYPSLKELQNKTMS